MAHFDEWTEWHLTATGWIEGNSKTTFSSIKQNETPINTVLTRRYRELQTSSFSKIKITHDELWNSGDESDIERLLKKFPFNNLL